MEKHLKSKGVHLDVCGRCNGAWFDADELGRIMSVASAELTPPDDATESNETCPKCLVLLRSFYYPQTLVKIDMCPNCYGLWLDKGEFTEIKAVRQLRQRKGELETHAPVRGFKGTLLRWINGAIDSLSEFD